MDLAPAAIFSSRPEAELARARLEAAGITASVLGDDAGGMYPNLSTSGVRVMVFETDLAEAHDVLAEIPDRD
jgi:hypothetical protein